MSAGSRFFVFGGDEDLNAPGEFTFRTLNETHGLLKLIPPLSPTVSQTESQTADIVSSGGFNGKLNGKLNGGLDEEWSASVVIPSMVTLVQYEDAASVLVSDVGFVDNGYRAQGYQVPTLVHFHQEGSNAFHHYSPHATHDGPPTAHSPPIPTHTTHHP